MTTFYKYCRLLGFKNRPRKRKSDDYQPLKTSTPNEVWCADVTIFKTVRFKGKLIDARASRSG
jgi:putative transposase